MIFSESETLELKSIYVDDIKKEIVAFANTRGGKIYIGVDSNGIVCGVMNPDFVIQQVSNTTRDAIRPDVTMFVRYEMLTIDGKNVIEVDVRCGAHRPYYLAAKGLRPEGVFVRQGTSSVPASDTAIRQMIKETDGDNYEDMRSINQDLSFEKVTEEFKKRGMPFSEPQMRTLGLIDGDGIYSNLALLLSDQCPHIIKTATFNGVDSQSFQDRREFTGSLLKQLDDAYAYMDMRNQTSATFEGLLRIDHKDYPDVALREALLNAIVHRDYSISAGTLISVFKNRIEIISIGGLAGGISYDDMMLGVSYCRNQKLANVFYRLRLIESYGIGMGKIMGSYNASAAKPQIMVSSGAFKMILPNMNQIVSEPNETVGIGKKSEPDNEHRLLDLFRKKKKMTRPEVEEALNVSLSSARRYLQKLINEGFIISEGLGKNTVYVLVAKERK